MSRKSKQPDGRKSNKPPVSGQVKKGEVRNRYGRAGKPKHEPPNEMDRIILWLGEKVVSQGLDGPVRARERLYQEEFRDAFRKGDRAARIRLIDRLHAAYAAQERTDRDLMEHLFERKFALTEEFHNSWMFRSTPPDIVPHPDHVLLLRNDVDVRGPMTRADRKIWEDKKFALRLIACVHAILRDEYRRNPTSQVLADLQAQEAYRRKVMRTVPKGWNWREEIWCRDSKLDQAKVWEAQLKELGYVERSAED